MGRMRIRNGRPPVFLSVEVWVAHVFRFASCVIHYLGVELLSWALLVTSFDAPWVL